MDYICFVHADMSYRNVECRYMNTQQRLLIAVC